jgi:toxin CptA
LIGSSTASAPAAPVINWAGIVSLLVGIFSTWLFMYGLVPAMQGPIAVALGGWDLSWLAGGTDQRGCLRPPGAKVPTRNIFLADSNHVLLTASARGYPPFPQVLRGPQHEPARFR